ncbi:hypothetical protein PAPHI01_0382 [Pancytospora philotis]|nr:hypothetical protein PAPHI01_0356 [Pancytospora philotis]KAI4291108.1 hypothetical protein PAPHI01_0382 [Pancytospora philotis]
MPIRGLDQGFLARGQQRLPLKVLEDEHVAIDGFWFLKKYLQTAGKEFAGNMAAAIEEAVKPLFELKSTKILWIWDGLDYARARRPNEGEVARADAQLSRASLADSARLNSTVEMPAPASLWTQRGSVVNPEAYVGIATQILRRLGAAVIRAPYSAIAQCVYSLKAQCASYAFTKVDALCYTDGTKIISEFCFKDEGHVDIVDRNKLFAATGFNLHGFQSYAFLSGCEICPTVPSYASNFSVPQIVELARNSRELREHLLDYFVRNGGDPGDFEKSDEAEYLRQYYRAFMCVEFHPIMGIDGRLECYSTADVPADLEQIFGVVLNERIYQLLYTCSLSPMLANMLAYERSFIAGHLNEVLDAFVKLYGFVAESAEEAAPVSDEPGCAAPASEAQEPAQARRPSPIKYALDVNILQATHASKVVKGLLGAKYTESNSIPRVLQLAFFGMLRTNADHGHLLALLNIDAAQRRDESADEITPQLVSFYNHAAEYITAIKDLAALAALCSPAQNDMSFSILPSDLLQPLNKEKLRAFIKENINTSSKLIQFLDFLK